MTISPRHLLADSVGMMCGFSLIWYAILHTESELSGLAFPMVICGGVTIFMSAKDFARQMLVIWRL